MIFQDKSVMESRCLRAIRKFNRPVNIKQIIRSLSWPRTERDALEELLGTLVDSGNLKVNDRKHYYVVDEGRLIRGTLQMSRRGNGYLVTSEFDDDLMVPTQWLNTAMHRDYVLVSTERRGHRLCAQVVEILERGTRSFVGMVHVNGGTRWLEPQDERLPPRVKLIAGDAAHGELVGARIVSYPNHIDDHLRAEIVTRVTVDSVAAREVATVIFDHGLSPEFPEKVLEEAEQCSLDETELINGYHADFRSLPFFTVDPESARDFDDAVCVAPMKNGEWKLMVAVADVSNWVTEDSAMDREAFDRGTSIYFPDRVIPMLPEVLSSDLCSLRPNVPRAVLVVEMRVSKEGVVREYSLHEAVIKSHRRLTYGYVQEVLDEDEIIEGDDKEIHTQIRLLQAVTRALRAHRETVGYLSLEIAEPVVKLDADGTVSQITASHRFEAHLMVEEAMLAANVSVAQFFVSRTEKSLFRVHGDPDALKLEQLNELMEKFGHEKFSNFEVTALSAELAEIGDEHKRDLLSMNLLRAMKKAEYTVEPSKHYGLGFEHYLHFTSPIRRYPDLIVHRQVRKLLRGEKSKGGRPLVEIAVQSNRKERLALEVERDLVSLYKCIWLSEHLSEAFDGFVTHMTDYGAFVKLVAVNCDGYLPFVINVEGQLKGPPNRRGRRSRDRQQPISAPVQLGEYIKVEVVDVNIRRRRVELKMLSDT